MEIYHFRVIFQILTDSGMPDSYKNIIDYLDFTSEDSSLISRLYENNKNNYSLFFSDLASRFENDESYSEINEEFHQQFENLTNENKELKDFVKRIQLENINLKKENDELYLEYKEIVPQYNGRLSTLEKQLADSRQLCTQYYRDHVEYKRLFPQWNALLPKHETLEKLHSKLKIENNNLDKRFHEIVQELNNTQQKLALATARIRDFNLNNKGLAGGGSRKDQLISDFIQLKQGLFRDVSSKILNSWKNAGSDFTFRSEEFYKIKSLLSESVFYNGMKYFTKDKPKIDAELLQIMEELSDVRDITPTVYLNIQKKIHAGLLRSNGVDHSDEALTKYIEETTQLVNQNLCQIAGQATTADVLSEIRKFVDSGLRLVRDIVNDPHSGEIFISDNDVSFDESLHEPSRSSEPKGKIKMTLYAGYRVAGNALVKSEVITYEDEPVSKIELPASGPSKSAESTNTQEEYDAEGIDKNIPLDKKNENFDKPIDLVNQAVVLQHAAQTKEDGGDENAC